MPDEFRLRPVDGSAQGDFNNAHEQGARALAAAIIAKHDARLRVLQDAGCHTESLVAQECINDIHRLVPPGAGKEKA